MFLPCLDDRQAWPPGWGLSPGSSGAPLLPSHAPRSAAYAKGSSPLPGVSALVSVCSGWSRARDEFSPRGRADRTAKAPRGPSPAVLGCVPKAKTTEEPLPGPAAGAAPPQAVALQGNSGCGCVSGEAGSPGAVGRGLGAGAPGSGAEEPGGSQDQRQGRVGGPSGQGPKLGGTGLRRPSYGSFTGPENAGKSTGGVGQRRNGSASRAAEAALTPSRRRSTGQ